MMTLKQNSLLAYWLDRIAWILLCILMADCCIFGAGRVLAVGSIGFRTICLAVLLVISTPLILSQISFLFRNRYFQIVLVFAVWLVVCAVIGLANNNDKAIFLSDIKGYCYFGLLPVALCLINTKQRLFSLMRVMLYASAVLAVFHVLALTVYLLDKNIYHALYLFCEEQQIGGLGNITSRIPRVFFRSGIYLFCGCGFSLFFYTHEKKQLQYPCITGLCLFALLISYTRSIYGGVIITAILCLTVLLFKTTANQRKRVFLFSFITVLTFSTIVSVYSLKEQVNYLQFAIDRTEVSLSKPPVPDTPPSPSTEPDGTDDDEANAYLNTTQQSDLHRQKTLSDMWENIKKAPIFGSGLGKAVDYRKENGTGLSEYFYLDIWTKMGLIGLALYVAPVLYALYSCIRNQSGRHKWVWMSILIGMMAVSFFNPYMNASLGICFYCCFMAAVGLDENTQNKIEEQIN